MPSLPRLQTAAFLTFCALTFFFVASWAWISDDAYITFRVVDNAVNGYGLRWNIDERVQVYTHPLWLLIHIQFYYFYRNIFLLDIGISAVLAAAAVGVAMRIMDSGRLHKIVLILLPLALSKAFRNHIINGLEAPLMLFLLAWFWHDYLRTPERIYRLLTIASLVLLTRLDGIMVMVLPMLWRVVNIRFRQFSIPRALAATAPITGWFAFCLVYYGFLFPNTKYAKLNTGLNTQDYIARGWVYYDEFKVFDRFGYLIICFSLCCAAGLVLWTLYNRLRDKTTDLRPLIIAPIMGGSILLHVAYVIRVAGDFMDGRFFVTPLFLAVILIYYALSRVHPLILALITIGMANIAVNRYNYDSTHNYVVRYGISNERQFYAWKQALFRRGGFITDTLNGTLFSGVIRNRPHDTKFIPKTWTLPPDFEHNKPVMKTGYIGVTGYTAGPGHIIIDELALTDPLLARLPRRLDYIWRAGHFERTIPQGYLYARKTGDTSRMVGSLAAYYQKLRLVTSAPLFSPERIEAVIGFQTGAYEKSRLKYVTGK